MSTTRTPTSDEGAGLPPLNRDRRADQAARSFAVDPSRNVVLEASAGTGKTRILVARYLNLIRAGVDPANILAITFTRKAAAEMRERILRDLRESAARSREDAARWRQVRDRLGDVSISTIDAFCLGLLREFPLEADLDPGFEMADETQALRLVDEAIDIAMRAGRRLAGRDETVGLAFASLGGGRLRSALGSLIARRLVAAPVLARFLASAPADLSAGRAADRFFERLWAIVMAVPGGLTAFVPGGPASHPRFRVLAGDLEAIASRPSEAAAGAVADRLMDYFFTKQGTPRKRLDAAFGSRHFASEAARARHQRLVAALATEMAGAIEAYRRDLNVLVARGVSRLFTIARRRHRRALEAHGVVDFTETLSRALRLLRKMDEFAQSRYRLESRYHHVLVDEFQDTSRAQWRLVARLIESWGEGAGLAGETGLAPSIFLVGDRKQSIYAFRDAEVRLMRSAGRVVAAIRPEGDVRRAITHSFRAVPGLLAFTNDLFAEVEKSAGRPDAFRYRASDRFPLDIAAAGEVPDDALGVVVATDLPRCAGAVAGEIDRLLAGETVRDRQTGVRRGAEPGDVAILFRSREGHREFERALEERRIPVYVYKGLGFFDADEVKDLVALVRFLAEPASDLRAAALARSRLVRLSDRGLRLLAPGIAAALTGGDPDASGRLDDDGDRRRLELARASLASWLALADRVPPADLLDRILMESAYAFELRGPRLAQARENVKKLRAIVRRIQNRGYATFSRVARHLDRLSTGEEGNAVVDATGAVNLMTVHAAKGLEFPIVFLVNIGRGTGRSRDPVVVERSGPSGTPLVAAGEATSGINDALRARDREETKRLLYVAVTRARDRLYLSGAVGEDGQLKSGPGSLAEVIPASLRQVLALAASAPAGSLIEWAGRSAESHRLRVCAAAETDAPRVVPQPEAAVTCDDLDAIDASAVVPRVPVTAISAADEDRIPSPGRSDDDRERADARRIGTLVHRLIQAHPFARETVPSAAEVRAWARVLARAEEPGAATDLEPMLDRVARSYLSLAQNSDLAAILADSACLHEVPFSMVLPSDASVGSHATTAAGGPVIVRGTIDCLVTAPDGRITVVDFKTGSRRAGDRQQLELYVAAARALFPSRPVSGLLVYATP